MTRSRTGWSFVVVQVVLLVALVLLPRGSAWSLPSWLAGLAWVLLVGGLALVAVAALSLGSALTPTPVPNGRGELRTGGLYRFVRHPIYSGVLAVVLALTVRSQSWQGLVLGVVTVAFFTVKARWEEARLVEAFAGYAAYAAVTPRFVPFLPRRLIRPVPTASPARTREAGMP